MTNDATDEASRWAWIAPDGVLTSGDEWDLIGALRAGELPPSTLVWRRTWSAWLPAARVAELATALPPATVEAPEEPVLSPTALTPPSRPPGTLPEPSGVRLPRPALARDGADKPAHFGPARPRGPSILGPPRETSGGARPSLPTLGGDEPVLARPMTTLRPPGAVPPPPRAAPAVVLPRLTRPEPSDSAPTQRRGAAAQRDTLPGTGTDSVAPLPAVAAAPAVASAPAVAAPPPAIRHAIAPASLPLPSELRAAVVLPSAPGSIAIQASNPPGPATAPAPAPSAPAPPPVMLPPARTTAPDFDTTLGSPQFVVDPSLSPVEVSAANLTLEPSDDASQRGSTIPDDHPPDEASFIPASDTAPPRRSSLPVPRSLVLGLVALAGITALLAGGMVALVLSRTNAEKRTIPAPSVAKPPPPAPKELGCRILQPAARLAESVHRPVPPLLANLVSEKRVAVGFAETPKNAAGLIVNLDTLDAEHAFAQSGDKALFGSVPLVHDNAATFVVDRAGGPVAGARTVAPGLVVGTAGGDFVRAAGNTTAPLWRGAASEKTTDPRVASTPSGHLVTFRRGGLGGRILYGWLDASGKPDGDLVAVTAPHVALAGTPDAAARVDDGLLVFAGRPNADAEWRVQLVTAPRRGAPAVQTFAVPAGGAGKGSIAPSATPLAGGGWVLQWTEGTTGQYQVRVQRLNAKLEPLGEARLVSPKGANSGQGALFATGSRLLSVFVQTTAGHDELWGASFECP